MLTNELALQQVQLKLKDLQGLIHDIEDERKKNENTIQCIYRNQKSNPSKLKSLYKFAINDAIREEKLLRDALKKIAEIREIRNERRMQVKNAGNKVTLRQGELMKLVHNLAKTLPLFVSTPGEKAPPLCGSIPADSSIYSPKPGDLVAASVKLSSTENNHDWILAEVVQYHHNLGKTEVVDIDAELKTKMKHKHILAKKYIIPLPQWRANPETDGHALFQKDTIVMALYPQTTTFYPGIVHKPPETAALDYEILFEDNSCDSGYSKPLRVPQRYVFSMKHSRKSLYS